MALLLNANDSVSRSYIITKPSPTHPIMPQGTGERTGNLADITTFQDNMSLDATTGLPISTGNSRIANVTPIDVTSNATVKVTFVYNGQLTGTRFMYSIFNNGALIERVANKSNGDTINVQNADKLYICIYTVTKEEISNLMVSDGSGSVPYEPYGYKIPISSANTTTPIYLGEVETTRRVKKLVLTGNENVSKDTGQDPTLYFLRYKHIQINSYCTHLRSVSTKPQSGEFSTVAQYDGYIFMNFGADIMNAQQSGNTVEGFKEYLAAQYAAGTPVTVWYVLATPETAVVNEPLMKIGDYADEVSNVSIPVTAGTNTLSVDTTVQPSEVTVNYKGWHPVQSVHEKSRNLFDENATNVNNGYITNGFLQSDGSITTNIDYRTSEYIRIAQNQSYTLFYGSNLNLPSVCFYDSAKNYISGIAYAGRLNVPFTTPQNAEYLRLSFRAVDPSVIMLNSGSTALPYEPYWK